MFITFWLNEVILSRDVPGQRSLSRDFSSFPCPGQENFFVLGCPTGRPVEPLILTHMDIPYFRYVLYSRKVYQLTALWINSNTITHFKMSD